MHRLASRREKSRLWTDDLRCNGSNMTGKDREEERERERERERDTYM
jgi:hypothetical protein